MSVPPTPIQQLSAQVANQIAAGEVVERPASVVKELVENSLDAGARRVDVEIEQAGSKRIRVRDDGCGVRQQDLELALCRHATSKLVSAEELAHITSLGFRGEALASIGSIARLELVSRPHDADSAWSVRGDNSNPSLATPASHPPGTSVIVDDLFHNVPARRRFLRAERTEFLHIEQLLRGLALSRFDVGFSLTHNQRTVFRVPTAEDDPAREGRVLRLCGRAFVGMSLHLNYTSGAVSLNGWLARPTFSRSQRDLQFLFVNGRLVRDRLIGHALRQAYGEGLPAGRHPAYVLHLQIDPGLVDVNVHPTKHEVRFRDTRLVHDFLSHCIDDALHIARSDSAFGTIEQSSPSLSGETLVRHTTQVAETPTDYSSEVFGDAGGVAVHPGTLRSGVMRPVSNRNRHQSFSTSSYQDLRLVQLHGCYLLVAQNEETMLVDLGAARAWLVKQELTEMFASGQVVAQPLLIPARVELNEAAVDLLDTRTDEVASLGFDLTRSAPRCVLVRRIPALLGEMELASMLAGLAQVVAGMQPGSTPSAEQAEALVAACKFDSTAAMSQTELESIWRALQSRPQGLSPPRRVMAPVGAAQLAALLKN